MLGKLGNDGKLARQIMVDKVMVVGISMVIMVGKLGKQGDDGR